MVMVLPMLIEIHWRQPNGSLNDQESARPTARTQFWMLEFPHVFHSDKTFQYLV